MDLSGTEKNILPSGCFGCSNSETLMEVGIVEQSLVAVLINSAGSQNTNVRNVGASYLTLDNPLMEVETSKCNPSFKIPFPLRIYSFQKVMLKCLEQVRNMGIAPSRKSLWQLSALCRVSRGILLIYNSSLEGTL